ncbi:MAG: nucleotidyltransferase domain-containing protein [Candidatus Omnitrophota bacterium]
MSLLQNTSNLSFCGSPRGEAEGLTAESIKILSSIIDPALLRRMTEIEFCNSLKLDNIIYAMIKLLLKTRLRKQLLSYSFTHADESYYVRELASFIHEDAGNLSRELRRLEEEGLYKSVVRGGAKFYSLNKKCPLFKELKSIIFKTEGVEGTLRKLAVMHKGISCAFIYGSYAKNKEKKFSDIDLVIVGDINRDSFTQDVRELERKFDREINFTIYTQNEFEKERKKQGGFLNLVVKGKVIILKGKIDGR